MIANLQDRAVVSKRTAVKPESNERTSTDEPEETTLVQQGTSLLGVRKVRTMFGK